ncbi:MAG: hypothetical protein KKA90_01745 [Nanoarchaeota archaeon]|nr:hypothetical protein [Nanoarchaeota archaeon]
MIDHDQHLLTDETILKKIVREAKITPKESVLEIGAGPGNLTRELCKVANHVTAVELDTDFLNELALLQEETGNLDIVFGNALDYLKTDHPHFLVLVGNIPYAICEPLLQALFREAFSRIILMVPTGFAAKLTGETSIGVRTAAFFTVTTLFPVSRKAFEPPPKTDSVVIRLTPKAGNRLVQLTLQQRDKKLGNAIREALIQRAIEKGSKMTKKEAGKQLNTLPLRKMQETKIASLSCSELQTVVSSLKRL